jgi:multidrug efflux pump subunit AcrA (membrane-fusion protein)
MEKAGIREARKRRFLMPDIEMPETKHESKAAGRWALLLGLVVAVAFGFFIYSGIHGRVAAASTLQHQTEQAAIEDVIVVDPKAAAPIDEVVLPGATQPYVDSPIYARTNGYLVKWFYDIGAKVKQGDLLAIIDTPELDQQLQQARADLETAKSNLALSKTTAERWQGLVKTRSVSQQSTDQAVDNLGATQASVDSYAANVRRLEALVSFEKVYAPFDGVITVRNTDTGWLINAGAGSPTAAPFQLAQSAGSPTAELFRLAQTNTLRIFVAVPEVYSRAARVGSTATLTLDEFPSETFHGKVTRTSQSIDMASRTLNTEIDVDNPTGQLLPGAYVHAHLKLPGQTRSVIIPSNTLLFRSEGLRVGVVRNGHAQLTPITIGVDFGATVQVTSGLTLKDQVIISPSDSLISGTPVRITKTSAYTTPTADTKQ